MLPPSCVWNGRLGPGDAKRELLLQIRASRWSSLPLEFQSVLGLSGITLGSSLTFSPVGYWFTVFISTGGRGGADTAPLNRATRSIHIPLFCQGTYSAALRILRPSCILTTTLRGKWCPAPARPVSFTTTWGLALGLPILSPTL